MTPTTKDCLLFKVREQIKRMDKAKAEFPDFWSPLWDQEAYDLMRRIEKDLVNARDKN